MGDTNGPYLKGKAFFFLGARATGQAHRPRPRPKAQGPGSQPNLNRLPGTPGSPSPPPAPQTQRSPPDPTHAPYPHPQTPSGWSSETAWWRMQTRGPAHSYATGSRVDQTNPVGWA